MSNTDVILIKYQSDMSDLKKELVALTASNKKIETELKNIATAGKKAGAEASEGFKKVGAVSKGLEGTFNSLKSQIAGVFAVQQIQQFVKEAVKAAAAAEGIERAFNRIAPEGTLNKLREATKGTVADVQLMANTVKASNFGIPVENLATLFKFAQQRARETGESVDYLVDSIVLGIGRKSPLILDNLGISAVRLREKFKDLNADQIDVGEVAKAVSEIVQEENVKMGEGFETSADKISRWVAEWANYKVAFGQFAIQVGTFLEGMAKNATKGDGLKKIVTSFISPAFSFFINNLGAGKKAAEELAKAEENAAITNEQYFKTKEDVVKVLDEELIALKAVYEQNLKDQNITETGIIKVKAQIKAINDVMEARKAEAAANLQMATLSMQQLENLSSHGDVRADKEIARRKKVLDAQKKAYDDQVKAEKDSLDKSIKNIESYYEAQENKAKEKFIKGEITEEELNESLKNIEAARLTNTLSTLQQQKAYTKEAQNDIKDLTLKTQTAIVDAGVDFKKQQIENDKQAQEELETAEKERLDNTLKNYQNYWQELENINVHFLKEGLYTQEEFDAIQQDNKINQLKGTLDILKDFGAKTVESQEAVNEETLDAQKSLNDAIVEENRKKNEKTTEDDKKAAEDKEKIQKSLYDASAELLTGFVDISSQTQKDAADARIEKDKEVLDEQLENEFLSEQQREALQEQFEEKRRAILNEQAVRDKQAKVAQAVIDGIVSVIAQRTLPERIAMGIDNLVRIGLLIAAPLPQYKEGDVDIQGPGTDTSDSILARISRGESVINARSTRKHKDILKVINRGNDEELMKLIKVKYYPADEKPEKKTGFADNVLNQLKLQNKFDDSNIVKQLKGIRPATARDIKELGNTITKGNREAALLNKLK